MRHPDGRPLWSRDAQRRVVPASTAKLLTTAAALDRLGPEHRFPTRLEARGAAGAEGGWDGDLVLVGGGDPSLGSGREGLPTAEVLASDWADAARAAGLRAVNGRALGNGTAWGEPEAPGGWAWDDLANHFAPPLDALILAENRFSSRFRTPSAEGEPATLLGTEPPPGPFSVRHRVRAGAPGSGDRTWAYAAPGGREILWRGTLPPGRAAYAVDGAWPHPSLAAAERLRAALEAGGIPVADGAAATEGPDARPARVLWEGTSPPLAELVGWTNRESLNPYAEAFLRALGERAGDASVAGSLEALEAWVRAEATAAGVDAGAWTVADGSGLSRRNALDAGGFTALLAAWRERPWFDAFFASLPRSGGLGTLASVAPSAPGRIAAKSGTLTGVRAYTGYVRGRSGTWYPFFVAIGGADAGSGALRLALEPWLGALTELP